MIERHLNAGLNGQRYTLRAIHARRCIETDRRASAIARAAVIEVLG